MTKYYLFKWWLSTPLPIDAIIDRLGLENAEIMENDDVVGAYYDDKGRKYNVLLHISCGEPYAVEKIKVYIDKRLSPKEEDILSDEMIEKIEGKRRIEEIVAEREELMFYPPPLYALLREMGVTHPIAMVKCVECGKVSLISVDIDLRPGDIIERYCLNCNKVTEHVVLQVGGMVW